jgi:hypothetical protein
MRVRLALIPLVAATALLAGCATATPPATTPTSTGPADNGISALAPADIVTKMHTALAAAKSFHMVGTGTDNGQKVGFDLKFSGKDFVGTVDLGGAIKLDLISIGTDIYLKAPNDFWSSQLPAGQATTLLALIQGKYVKIASTNASVAALVDPFRPENMTKPEGDVTKGDTKTIDGQPAIALVDSKDGGKLYVATTGDPLPLSIEGGSLGTDGSIQFKEYNVPVTVTAPAAADVFDLKALMGG